MDLSLKNLATCAENACISSLSKGVRKEGQRIAHAVRHYCDAAYRWMRTFHECFFEKLARFLYLRWNALNVDRMKLLESFEFTDCLIDQAVG